MDVHLDDHKGLINRGLCLPLGTSYISLTLRNRINMPGILPMKVIKVGANAQTRIAQAWYFARVRFPYAGRLLTLIQRPLQVQEDSL